MNLFKKHNRIISGSNICKPTLKKKVKILFTDVETEGKKLGYTVASNEYWIVYKKLEDNILETKSIIENQKNNYNSRADSLINKLESLELELVDLEEKFTNKLKEMSKKCNIPINDLKISLESGPLLLGNSSSTINELDYINNQTSKQYYQFEKIHVETSKLYFTKIGKLFGGGLFSKLNLLDVAYRHRLEKLMDAEIKGYEEARVLYQNSIEEKKKETKRLKEEGNKEINDLLSLIDDLFSAIVEIQLKIAELNIIL